MSIRKQNGFTLAELSIVLVIVGIIIAGITAGTSLTKSARLKSIISEVDQYKFAYSTFKLEYNARPGDFSKATTYWGGVTGDGNGNGQIFGDNTESVYVWEHFALSGLMPGSYTGVHEEIGAAMIGKIFPKSNYNPKTGYEFFYGVRAGWSGAKSTETNNFLRFGEVYTPGVDRIGADVLSPEDTKSLDDKMDDGLPGLGILYSRSIAGSCYSTAVTTTSIYNVATSGKRCYLHFIFD